MKNQYPTFTIYVKIVIFFCIIVSFNQPVLAGIVGISEAGWSVNYWDSDAEPHLRGTIETLIAPNGDIQFESNGDNGLLSWGCNGFYPESFDIIMQEDGKYLFFAPEFVDGNNNIVPMQVEILIDFTRDEISFEFLLTANDSLRFEDGFGIQIPLNQGAKIDFSNTTGDTASISLFGEISDHNRKPFQGCAGIQSEECNMNIVLRNPLHPVFLINQDGLELEIITVAPPNSAASGFSNIASILGAGNSIETSWAFIPRSLDNESQYMGNIAVFSPHPESHEQSVFLAFDDIPSLEPRWAVPTDPENLLTPVTSNLLSILDMFPDINYTWLILTDNIQKMGRWYFKDWWPPDNSVRPDSNIIHSGNYSCCLSVIPTEHVRSSAILNSEPVEPWQDYIIGGWLFAEHIDEERGYFTIIIRDWLTGDEIASEVFQLNQGEWTSCQLGFNSQENGAVSVRYSYHGREGTVYLDDAFIKKNQTESNLMLNPGFEEFQPFIHYDPTEDPIWANARGFLRIATEASQEYHNWLKIVQDDSDEWSYSNRIGLCIHGMHHTPDSTFISNPAHLHEFNFYDPMGDSIRIAHIEEDLNTIGLDPEKIFSFIRFPGHRHTESVFEPLFRVKCRIFDYGPIYDMTNLFGRIFRGESFMWQTHSVAWFDNPNFYMNDLLEKSMDLGNFALLGVHYHLFATLKVPGHRETTISLFNWLESSYPELYWFKGDELGEFWDELSSIRGIKQTGYRDRIILSWEGGTTLGETVMIILNDIKWKPFKCFIDGSFVDWDHRGQRIFIQLPDLDDGTHTLDIIMDKVWESGFEETSDWKVSIHSPNKIAISNLFENEGLFSVSIFNVLGKEVHSFQDIPFSLGRRTIYLPVGDMANGAYFVRIASGNREFTVPVVHIR